MHSHLQVVEESRLVLSDLCAPVRLESVVDWVEDNVELPTSASIAPPAAECRSALHNLRERAR
jgi:hypothetical protein